MIEYTNRRPWDIETPSQKILHNKYYGKRGTTDKTKHKPSMQQPRIRLHESRQGLLTDLFLNLRNSKQVCFK